METAGSPSSGVVVFDTAQGTSQEFASGLPATDLNLGLDGKLWVLAGGTAYSYDPTTLSALDSISLAAASVLDIRSLAVDAVGDFYLATWNGFIVHLAGDGSLVESLSVVPGLHDIDIAPNGLLIFGSGSNGAWLSDTTLSGARQIQTGGWQTFVAFVPEPGTGMLVGIGLVAFARNGRRGSRASTRLRRWIVGG